jgi:hypothetical protein
MRLAAGGAPVAVKLMAVKRSTCLYKQSSLERSRFVLMADVWCCSIIKFLYFRCTETNLSAYDLHCLLFIDVNIITVDPSEIVAFVSLRTNCRTSNNKLGFRDVL